MKTKHALAILPLAAMALVGCSRGHGTLQLSLTNVPVDLNVGTHRDLSDVSHFVVTINEVKAYVVVEGDDDAKEPDPNDEEKTVAGDGKSGWKSICSTPADFDLQALTDGRTTPLCPGARVDEGKVTQLNFVIPKAVAQWKNGDPDANMGVLNIVTIGVATDVKDEEKSDLLLNLDAGASIMGSSDGHGYDFSPKIKVKK